MKRVWIAGGILVLLCAVSVWSGIELDRFTQGVTASLEQAQGMAEKGSWEEAARATDRAARRFEARAFYLHVTLRHDDVDAVKTAFREVEQLLSHRERLGEYTAANARLIVRLELLAESERFSLLNVL